MTAALCIACPKLDAYSETFISSHIRRLPMPIRVLHGTPLLFDGEGRYLLDGSLSFRLVNHVRRHLFKTDDERLRVEAMTRFFRREKIAAVLAEFGQTGVEVMEACLSAGIPLVVHFHGYDASSHEVLEKYGTAYRQMFQQAAAVVAVSRAMEEKLIALGAPPDKVHYNPYGVDCEAFGGAKPAEAPPVFLAVGRFVDKKAPQLLLLAFAKVHAACPGARLRMIGDGYLLDACRELASALGLEKVVDFLGSQPHGVVQDEMTQARCFVQHSIEAINGDCEGTPVGILEAGASALPVVATRHAGIPDVVVDGTTGLLVDERDVDGMAAQMLRLANDSDLAAKLGQAGRERIENHFTMRQSIDRLWKIIESCILAHQGCK